jgi:hypothetical protein
MVAVLLVFAGRSASAQFPLFSEEAVSRGVSYVVTDGAFGHPGQYGCGVALVDLDGDGDDDIIGTGATSGQIALFANSGAGHFTNVTGTSGLLAHTKVSGVVAADYDADGDLDLFFTRWLQPAILYRNEGALNFVQATAQAGLTGIAGAGAGSSFGDFDQDGDLDLAIAIRTATNGNVMRNRFYRNNGNGTFTEIAAALGVDDAGASFQCILQDLDRDGDPDLYVSNDKGTAALPNRYFRNTGGAFLSEPQNGACIVIDSMGVFAGDLDMNGFVDLYCTNLPEGHAFLWTSDAQTYQRREHEADIDGAATGWGAVMFDADNDGDQDLFACSMSPVPDYLWLTEAGFPLVESQAQCAIGDLEDSYCVATGDVDRDGDVDLLMQSRTTNLRLYVNEVPKGNHGVSLQILGAGKNTHAVGALVDITVAGRTALREVMAGSCYKSQSSYTVHAGLGDATSADLVVVRWPRVGTTRETRTLTRVPTGMVLPVYPPSLLGDRARDGRVDAADYAACIACLNTPFVAACAAFDVNGDCSIDDADVQAITLRMLDLSRDGEIGAADLSLLLAAWGRPDADFTGDNETDAADLALLLQAW